MHAAKSKHNGESGLMKLYVEQLKDVYSAENQILKALPKLAKAASTPAWKAS
jgi:ferritin-like metal-binding protein YciE